MVKTKIVVFIKKTVILGNYCNKMGIPLKLQ